ncbi:MAG: lipopolysaccharide biosynthesis protein [Candidatus Obscuribacterales bacterium]|nr:lipopolysaccharide biosynthesis protein [Steroidobacteraceae bacterium]
MSIAVSTSTKPTASLAEILQAVRRRRRPLLWVASGTLVAALLCALFWPPTFVSTGTILIEQQELPADLVRSTISSFADQRIQIITQRVMTTENLLRIIDRYKLYEQIRKTKPREVLIGKLRDNIGFEMISAEVIDPRHGNPTKATIAFSISFKDRSASTAAQVANELVSLYLQENIDSRKRRTADASNFLGDESERLNTTIVELQAKLATFKEQHLNDLPELAGINQQILTRTDEEVREVDTRLRSLDQQIVYLDAQLAQLSPTAQVYTSTGERVMAPADRLKYLRAEQARVSGLYAANHPDVVRIQREIAGLEKQTGSVETLNDLERQLQDATTKRAAASERYGAEHPDVAQLDRLIDGLQTRVVTARAAPPTAQSVSDNAGADNPGYIQIKAQREASANERRSLEQKRSDLSAKLLNLETRLAKTPAVERDYMALTRDLENNQLKYREVRQKQMEAQVAQNMEDDRKGERFTLIEPPLVPEEPASPNRLVIMVLGVFLAMGAAVGVVAVIETLDTSVRNKRDLESLLNVAPLAVLPFIETQAERGMRAQRQRLSLAGMAGTAVLAVALMHFFYKPLDVLWQVALRRFG